MFSFVFGQVCPLSCICARPPRLCARALGEKGRGSGIGAARRRVVPAPRVPDCAARSAPPRFFPGLLWNAVRAPRCRGARQIGRGRGFAGQTDGAFFAIFPALRARRGARSPRPVPPRGGERAPARILYFRTGGFADAFVQGTSILYQKIGILCFAGVSCTRKNVRSAADIDGWANGGYNKDTIGPAEGALALLRTGSPRQLPPPVRIRVKPFSPPARSLVKSFPPPVRSRARQLPTPARSLAKSFPPPLSAKR